MHEGLGGMLLIITSVCTVTGMRQLLQRSFRKSLGLPPLLRSFSDTSKMLGELSRHLMAADAKFDTVDLMAVTRQRHDRQVYIHLPYASLHITPVRCLFTWRRRGRSSSHIPASHYQFSCRLQQCRLVRQPASDSAIVPRRLLSSMIHSNLFSTSRA